MHTRMIAIVDGPVRCRVIAKVLSCTIPQSFKFALFPKRFDDHPYHRTSNAGTSECKLSHGECVLYVPL